MKKLFLFVACIFLSCFVFAQTPTIESICKELAIHPITKGDFTQTKKIISAKGERQLKSSGTFIFSLEGIVWDTQKPFPSKMIIGTDFIAQIAPDGSKKITDTSDNQVFANVASTIIAVFSNDAKKLQESFNVSISPKSDNTWFISLLPKDSTIASVIKEIDLSVKLDNGATLLSLFMTEASDNSTEYSFTNHNYPKELTADEKTNFISK